MLNVDIAVVREPVGWYILWINLCKLIFMLMFMALVVFVVVVESVEDIAFDDVLLLFCLTLFLTFLNFPLL